MKTEGIQNIDNLLNQIGVEINNKAFVQSNVLDSEANNIYQRIAADVLTLLNESYILEDFDSNPEKVYQKVLKIVEEIAGGRDMKVEGVQGPNNGDDKILPQLKQEEQIQKEGLYSRLSIIYERAKAEGDNPLSELPTIKKLKSQSENIYKKLINMVEEIISKQVKTELFLGSPIKPQEELGEETISEKIVDFIKEVSKGEKGKIDILIKGISEGFKLVEDSFGRLPEISIRTYERIVEKLNNYTIMEAINKEPEKTEVIIRAVVEEVIAEQLKDSGLLGGIDLSKANNKVLKYIELAKKDQGIFIQKETVEINIGELREDILENKIIKQGEFIKVDNKNLKDIKPLVTEKPLGAKIKELPLKKQLEIENTSGRIVSLIKEASRENKPRMALLIKTVKETFENAEKHFGLLPESSKRTYSRIMERLEAEGYYYRYMWPFLFGENLKSYSKRGIIGGSDIKIYLLVILFILILFFGIKLF